MTDRDRRIYTALRLTLAGVAIADLLSFLFFLQEARAAAVARSVPIGAAIDFLSQPVVSGIVVIIGIVGAIAFGWRAGRLWPGVIALAALTLLSTAHGRLFGSPWRHLFYSGLCLAGWLVGLAVSRRRGTPADESYARTGAIALLGAAYVNAGVSKLALGAGDWISALPIQAVVVGQDGLVADDLLSAYRIWVVTTPPVAALFSIATVVFELAGPLMLLGGGTRVCVALGLLAMHANIYLMTDILYWESMLLLAVFGLMPEPPSLYAGTSPASRRGRWFVPTAVGLAIVAIAGIAQQTRRYTATMAGPTAATIAPMAPPTEPPLRKLGPFTVGQTLADGWSVDALSVKGDGFIAALTGATGRAAFEVSCAPSPHQSPFDLGAAHIFYSSDLPFTELESAGLAVQQAVRTAAGGDVCEQITAWRRAASTDTSP